MTGWFLGNRAADSWDQVSENASRIDVGWVAVSLPILFASFVWFGLGWVRILGKLGHSGIYLSGLNIWAKAQFGKYLPGLGWYVLARLHWGEREGISKRLTVTSSAIEVVLMVLTGGLVALSIALFSPYTWCDGSPSASASSFWRRPYTRWGSHKCRSWQAPWSWRGS